MKLEKEIVGYLCTTNWLHECEDVLHSVKIFNSIESLKESCGCTHECGIVEIKLSFNKIIEAGSLNKYIK